MDCYLSVSWAIYGTSIIILGLIGNLLSIFVLRRSAMKYLGIRKHLILLSFSDFIICAIGATESWADFVFKVDIQAIDTYVCKISVFVVRTCMMYSSWILLVISVDRLDRVFFPMKIARSNRLGLKLGLSLIVFAVLQTYTLYFYEVVYIPSGEQLKGSCRISNHDKEVSKDVLKLTSVIFTTLYSVIPCIILTICNIAIVCRLNVPTQLNMGQNVVNGRKKINIRLMVLLSMVFIVTTGPLGTIIVMGIFFQLGSHCAWGYLSLLAFTNNAVNFLLYVFSGKKFRRELVKLFKIKRSLTYEVKRRSCEISIVKLWRYLSIYLSHSVHYLSIDLSIRIHTPGFLPEI